MKIIRDVRVAEKLGGASRATPWRKAKSDPDFPKPVKISEGITGWVESEIDEYLELKVAKARLADESKESRGALVAQKRAAKKRQIAVEA